VESARTTEHGWRDIQSTGDNNGILDGNQVYLPISVPVNVVGNAAAVLGQANASGAGVNNIESAHTTEGWWPGGGGIQSTGDNNGIANGNQLYAPISIPINACGNSIALLGGAYSQALCANNVFSHGKGHWKKESGHVTEGGFQSVGDNNGILNGNQLYAPISLPVNLAGNSVAVLGSANSHAVAVNESGHDDGFLQSTGDNNGILNGNQFAVPINVPINVCGNALGILGSANTAAACMNGHAVFVDGDDDCNDPCWGDDNDGHNGHGHGHGHGHGNGHGNGNDNAGDNGDDDSYLGDHGAQGNGNGNGYGGNQGASNGGYGDTKPAHGYGNAGADKYGDSKGDGGRDADESSPVTGLTETVSGVSDNSGLGGLGLLNTLR